MCTTQIIEGELKDEILSKATNDVLKFFKEELSFAEMQSLLLKGINSAMFNAAPEDPFVTEDLAQMLQASNFALKLLRPFAAVVGQVENDYYFKH